MLRQRKSNRSTFSQASVYTQNQQPGKSLRINNLKKKKKTDDSIPSGKVSISALHWEYIEKRRRSHLQTYTPQLPEFDYWVLKLYISVSKFP